jgi:TolB protein
MESPGPFHYLFRTPQGVKFDTGSHPDHSHPMPHSHSPGAAMIAVSMLLTTPFIATPGFATGNTPMHASNHVFSRHQDIGNPALAGKTVYDPETQTYTLTGAGENMWFGQDQFHFAFREIKGDFIIQASIAFVGEGSHEHRKIGIMARNALTGPSAHANASIHGDTLSSLQFRSNDGADTGEVKLSVYHPTDIQFERKGNVFTFSAAVFGEDYKSVSQVVDLNETVHAGLFICSHLDDTLETATFHNVRFIVPAADDFVPYRDYIGSHLEVMDIHTGHRRILHSENRSLQAPNWTPDGKHLLYNADGRMYRFEIETGLSEPINTGPCTRNNNDHVLSWGGAELGISHHVAPDWTSVIYTLPVEGSDQPIAITDPAKGHSYLHGWSPDNRELLFTGYRNGQYDIWKINIETREETQLTHQATLDDGSEYSPCGQWIYFNSVRTGTMQIWRMRADGSGQEPVTFDAYNNWFPHFSPDGKWIVFLAYPTDIDPTDHPFYKKVYLRLMPASGGVPRTIAYIYGGQGTINVPSWSPCSRYLAFVSNTRLDG